jgi:hypothetical protein
MDTRSDDPLRRAESMVKKSHGYLSIIGFSCIEPLLKLLETLEAASPKVPNEVQTGRWENGYSAAIVVLAAVIFESTINMIRYHEKDTSKDNVAKYFAKISPDPELAAAIDEVFAIRDAIVHNHLWDGQIFWEKHRMRFLVPPTRQEGYGNTRFEKVMDPVTRCSRRLGLNLFPNRIWRRDVHIVLKTVSRAFTTLQVRYHAYLSLDIESYEFQGQELPFYEIIAALPEEDGR